MFSLEGKLMKSGQPVETKPYYSTEEKCVNKERLSVSCVS